MARYVALAWTARQHWPLETLRVLIVSGCAIALIAAGPAIPLN